MMVEVPPFCLCTSNCAIRNVDLDKGSGWRWKPLFVFLGIVLFLWVSAYSFIYSFRSYFNDKCYITEENRNDLETAIVAICELYEQHNQTYWLDFGTLLGAYRMGDIIPHDGDGDVSRLIPAGKTIADEDRYMEYFTRELKKKLPGASVLSGSVVTYRGMTVDLCKWTPGKDGTLYRYIPGHPIYTQFRRRLPTTPYDSGWYLPPGRIRFRGRMLPAPHNVPAVLQKLYGDTYNKTVHYKWRCWFESQ